MPDALTRACSVMGCGKTTPCPDHSSKRVGDRQRGSATSRGYDGRWRKAADLFLAMYPLCGMRKNGAAPVMSRCYDQGRKTAARQVDHVVPHRGDRRLFWDANNWQSLCASCGAAKSRAGL